jgi:site-specific DNA-methyltransferase (adenine-specific)
MKKEDLNKRVKLMLGDNIESLKKLPVNSIDSVVTDGPYGLTFMNKKWDYDVPSVDFWKEVYRVLKPGGHILSFGGTRTYHRMVVNIEDAGFEIRDQIMWIYGSGFPKSHNIGKAVDKIEGNEREIVGDNPNHRKTAGLLELGFQDGKESSTLTKGQSKYEGWGTALKPANEPICVARKPLSEKTIADNVIKWGTGGINIDGCRVGSDLISSGKSKVVGGGQLNGENTRINVEETFSEGRFPANIILDEGAAELLDEQSGISGSGSFKKSGGRDRSKHDYNSVGDFGSKEGGILAPDNYGDKGGASRYFFNVKNYGGTEDFFIYKENNIIIWNIKSLDTQEYNMEENIEASDALKQARESICQKPELYGNNTMVKYLMTTISITKMKTHSIMNLVISNACTKMNIGHFTLMIDEKQSQLLTEESILNVQIVSNQNALVSSIKTNQEVLVPIVSYVLEENLVSGETTIESTITNTTENTGSNRFLYVAKVSKAERNMGLDVFEDKDSKKIDFPERDFIGSDGSVRTNKHTTTKNNHPTVKPINLMTYLCRLITPTNGIVLDTFMGSGSTGIAAQLEGFRFVGMEMDEDYFKIAEARIENFEKYKKFIKK